MLTIILYFIFLNTASYILEKYSDFPKMKNFSDLGYNDKMLNQKIICLSLHRSGTQSLNKFLKNYGLNGVHWGGWIIPEDNMHNLTIDQILNMFKKKTDQYQYFLDHPFNLMYEYFDQSFNDTKFIYIKRNINDWTKSVHKLCSYRNNKLNLYESMQYEKYLGFRPSSLNEMTIDNMKYVYIQHEKSIKKYFNNKSNLLELDLNEIGDGIEILNFLEIPFIKDNIFPNIDASREKPTYYKKI